MIRSSITKAVIFLLSGTMTVRVTAKQRCVVPGCLSLNLQMLLCGCAHVCVCVCVWVRACVHVHVHVQVHVRKCMGMFVIVNVYVCVKATEKVRMHVVTVTSRASLSPNED